MKKTHTKTLKIVAILTVALLIGGSIALVATASAPDPTADLSSFIATEMKTEVLLTDSGGVPMSDHQHAEDGGVVPTTIVFERPSRWAAFSATQSQFALPALHITKTLCPHPYGQARSSGGGTVCVFDSWHGTPCAFAVETQTTPGPAYSQACNAHKQRYGSTPPWTNTGYPATLQPGPYNRFVSYCDPATQSSYCDTTSPGSGGSGGSSGGNNGLYNLKLVLTLDVETKNLATPVALEVSAVAQSSHPSLALRETTDELPLEGGTAIVEFEWTDIPGGALPGVMFNVGALATATDIDGKVVSGDASGAIRPVLDDGQISITISPASFSGVGVKGGKAIKWQEVRPAKASSSTCGPSYTQDELRGGTAPTTAKARPACAADKQIIAVPNCRTGTC